MSRTARPPAPPPAAPPHGRFRGAASPRKAYRLGTHRTVAPEETWQRLRPLLPRLGVTRVADVTRLDRVGIPVWQAVRPATRNLSVSQGKGATAEAARASAAMEAVELWHAERADTPVRTRSTLREMAWGNRIPEGDLRWLPDTRRRPRARLEWLRADALDGGRHGWLPRDMVEIDYRLPDRLRPGMFLRTSNGLASGNHPAEALLHGLSELVERHGLHLAHYQPERRRPLDPDRLRGHPAELAERIRAAGLRLALWDLTWELGQPVVLAEIVGSDLPVVWRGSGSHPSGRVALARALAEAAQSRLTFVSGARDDLPPLAPAQAPDRLFRDFVPPAGGADPARLAEAAGDDLEEDVAALVERLAARGHPPFAVDLSRPEIGVPVSATFAPGLLEPPLG